MKQLASRISHYLRVYYLLAKISLEEILIFRFNGLLMGLAPIVWLATVLVFLGVIFSKVKNLGGWTLWETIFLTGVAELIFVISWSSFLTSLRTFVNDVRLGKFDQSLLKPINPKFLASFRQLDLTLLGSFLSTLLIFFFALLKVADKIDSGRAFGFLLLLGLAYVISYLFHLIFASFALALVNARTLLDFIFETTDFGHYPAEIYPMSLRVFLTFFFPVLFFGYVPTAFLLGKIGWEYLFYAFLVAAVLYLISCFVWKANLKHYQSASS